MYPMNLVQSQHGIFLIYHFLIHDYEDIQEPIYLFQKTEYRDKVLLLYHVLHIKMKKFY